MIGPWGSREVGNRSVSSLQSFLSTATQNPLETILRLPSRLCLDAPFVALGWAYCLGAQIRTGPAAALFFSVWLVYLADRLLDARRIPAGLRLSDRHRWAQNHFGLLSTFAVLCVGIMVAVLFCGLGARVFVEGLVLCFSTGFYYFIFRFSTLHQRFPKSFPFKEITISLCFTMGIMIIVPHRSLDPHFLAIGLGMVLLFAANCLLIARSESALDHQTDPAAHFSRVRKSGRLPEILSLCAITAGLYGRTLRGEGPAGVALVFSGLAILGLAIAVPSGNSDKVQPIADGILLSPWILVKLLPFFF